MADAPLEAADSIAPHNIGFRIDEGRTTAPYFFKGEEFNESVLAVTGENFEGFDPDQGGLTGKIFRSLPFCHPQFPFMFSSSGNFVGRGVPIATASSEFATVGITPIDSEYGLYPEYTGTVEFLQRPYHVLPDSQIEVETDIWIDEYGNPQLFDYANEYDRFVEVDEKFDPKIISATQGQLIFVTGVGALAAALPAPVFVAPHLSAFAGTPRIPFPETVITVRWHQVPYRYVSSPRSFLKRYALRVNQLLWEFDQYVFQPGELLYLGFAYSRWTPPFPGFDLSVLPQRLKLEKWCNLELTFAYVNNRVTPDPPDLPNLNWISDRGHNLLPWFGSGNVTTPGRNFYYVCGYNPSEVNNKHYWSPIFESCPMQILFTDPDYLTNNPYDP